MEIKKLTSLYHLKSISVISGLTLHNITSACLMLELSRCYMFLLILYAVFAHTSLFISAPATACDFNAHTLVCA